MNIDYDPVFGLMLGLLRPARVRKARSFHGLDPAKRAANKRRRQAIKVQRKRSKR